MERAINPAQHEQNDEGDDPIDLESLPSDLMSSIMYLRSQMMQFHPAMPPVVLHSQLRAMLWGSDLSDLDRELDSLRRANTVRMFRISSGENLGSPITLSRAHSALSMISSLSALHASGQDELTIMLTPDYADALQRAVEGQDSRSAYTD
jgi:hypothetical protein